MRFPQIYDYILSRLGHPTVKVELTCYQVEKCVQEAIKKWAQYQGMVDSLVTLQLTAGTNGYDIPTEIEKPYERNILELYYEPHDVQYDDDTLYLLINQYFYYFRSSAKQLMTDYTYFKGYIEDLKRTLGAYGTWNIWNQKLYVHPKPSRTMPCIIRYKSYPEDAVIDENEWVMRYSFALAKDTLANIRGKFTNGILGPGGAIALNAADLRSQAEKERETLINELRQRAKPVGIITG